MKEGTKLTLAIVGLVAIFGAAIIGYNYLSDKYRPTTVLPNAAVSGNTESENTGNDASEESVPEGENGEIQQQAAPDFTVYDKDGNAVKFSDRVGEKPVIINFWATWCGPCKSEMPHFEKAYNEYRDKIDFMMINPTDGVNDTEKAVEEFLADTGYTFPVYYDTESDAGITYGITGFPMTFFIDKDGYLLGYFPGAMDEATLYECIDIVLGE